MSENLRHYSAATLSMLLGTAVIFGVVITMNELSRAPERERGERQTQFAVEQPDAPQEIAEPEPPPQEPPQEDLQPPPPLANLSSGIGSVDIPIPEFDTSGLGAFDGGMRAADGDMTMTDDTVDDPPEAISQGAMRYPTRAKAQGVEGRVVVSMLIGIDGVVQQVRVLESEPEGIFDEVAADGVRQWRFEPARYQGDAVRVWARQTVRFDLS